MEGAVGGGGGHGLASGAVRVSDLDILRDNPGSAASRAAPGRHDREAARAKPAQPAGSAVMAAKELRKLAPALFEKILSFGAHSNPSNARSAVVGKALQAVCICAKRGLPTPEERRAGRPEGCADSEETGTDSQTLVVLTGGRVEDERAVAADVKAARSCVEVLPQHLVDQNVWARFLTGTAAVTLSIKDTAEALTMFGNALQIFIRANSANAACWGVDLLLAVRCEERKGEAKTLVMLPTRGPDAVNASLQDRLLAARREWLSDDMLRGHDDEHQGPNVLELRTREAVDKWTKDQEAPHLKPMVLCTSPGQAVDVLWQAMHQGESLAVRAERLQSRGGYSTGSSAKLHSQSSEDHSSPASGSQGTASLSETPSMPGRESPLCAEVSASANARTDDSTRSGGDLMETSLVDDEDGMSAGAWPCSPIRAAGSGVDDSMRSAQDTMDMDIDEHARCLFI